MSRKFYFYKKEEIPAEQKMIAKIFDHAPILFRRQDEFDSIDNLILFFMEQINEETIKIIDEAYLEYRISEFLAIMLESYFRQKELNLKPFSAHNIYLDSRGCAWMTEDF